MSRHLRTAAASGNTLIVIAVWAAYHNLNPVGSAPYLLYVRRFIEAINAPLVVIWNSITSISSGCCDRGSEIPGVSAATTIILLSVTILAAVAAFWYFAVREIQIRLDREIGLTRRSRALTIALAFSMLVLGIGCFWLAWSDELVKVWLHDPKTLI